MDASEDDIFGGGFGTAGSSQSRAQHDPTGFTFDTDEMNPFGDSSVLWGAEPSSPSPQLPPQQPTAVDLSLRAGFQQDDSDADSAADDQQLSRRTEALQISQTQPTGTATGDLQDRESGALSNTGAQSEPTGDSQHGATTNASEEEGSESGANSTAASGKPPGSSGYAAQPAVQTARRVGIIKRGLRSPRVLGKQLSPASFEDPLSSAAASNDANTGDPLAAGASRASVDTAYSTPTNPLAGTNTRQTRSMSEARHRLSIGAGRQPQPQPQLQSHGPHPYDQQLPPSQQQEQITQAHQHTDRVSTTASPPSSSTASGRPSMQGPSPSRSSTSKAYLSMHQRRRSLDPTPVDEIPRFTIHVTEPVKVSDSLKSYIAYKVRTQSDAPMFRESDMIVRRRYRDFDWLIQELVARHPGIIVPPIPEKQSMGRFEDEFVEARRAGLESCLIRISEHPVLWCDDVFRLFIEADDFPTKARMITENRVAAEINGTGPPLSGGSATSSSLFGDGWGGSKYKEKDEWFSKRMQELDAIEEELRALLRALEYSQKQRRELSIAHGELSEAYLKMASQELSKSLSNGLTDMGSLQQKLRVLQSRQGVADFAAFQLTTDEYIRMIGAVRTAFSARGRAYMLWQASLNDLIKRRKVLEGFVQHPARSTPERLSQLKAEIARAEIKTEGARNAFDDVSTILKNEMARFDLGRVRDFQAAIESYLVSLIETQEEIVVMWEAYLASLANTETSGDTRPTST
ncbi:Vacuolar protein sorting-associated protein vps5 [Coemansia sp. Benny D115]|nr:Vacuolar protein sorting-associated protein vps5 [Coemansia sp. Benny D115]